MSGHHADASDNGTRPDTQQGEAPRVLTPEAPPPAPAAGSAIRSRRFWYSAVSRLGESLLVALIVVTLSFVLVHLVPGDPAQTILGVRASPEKVAALRAELGLDEPLWRQYLAYMSGIVRGDLGDSASRQGFSVAELLLPPLGVTMAVIGLTTVLSVVGGTATGIMAAFSRRRSLRALLELGSTTALATPPFLFGLVLLAVVAVQAGLAPAGGWGHDWPGHLAYLWLPSLALTAYLGALVHRAVHTSAKEVMRQDFVEASFLRGQSPLRVALRHVLPNSLLPTITVVGLNIGTLVGGAAVIEAVFDLPGIGTQVVNAVSQRDYPTIQGAAVITALVVIAGNLLADLMYAVVDPRAGTHGD
ncbi:ABC transporter permease [Streptomyces sp. NPDC055607]